MASPKVAALVRDLSRDASATRLLRTDPSGFAKRFGLEAADRAVLADVDRFFRTERPIVSRPASAGAQGAKSAAPSKPMSLAIATRTPVIFVPTPLAGFTASADTGTLLPGPNTGTFFDPLSGEPTAGPGPGAPISPGLPVGPAQPAPQPAPAPRPLGPTPPAPALGPMPGFGPIQPAPATPSVPSSPAGPGPLPDCHPAPGWRPDAPRPAWTPANGLAPQSFPVAGPTGFCPHSGNESIVAIVAMVNATAQTALTAIAAMAQRKKTT